MIRKLLVFSSLLTVVASQAAAAPWAPTHSRCTYDQLSVERGKARTDWAIRYRGINPYGLTTANGRDARYLSNANAITVNDTTAVVIYPVYVDPTSVDLPPWRGPGAAGTATEATATADIINLPYTIKPVQIQNDALCEAGCYTPNQKILFESGEVDIAKAQSGGRLDLLTLTPNSIFGKLALTKNPVLYYTMDPKPATQKILTFHMESGGQLSVTTEHPLVTSDGAVQKAKLFAVGDQLVKQDGSLDQIVNIDDDMWFGQVYNLKPVSTDLTSNILIAQGYLNGSGRFQSEFVDELNRVILRTNIPNELIPGA